MMISLSISIAILLIGMVVVIDISPAALCRRIIIKEDGSHDGELNYGNKGACG